MDDVCKELNDVKAEMEKLKAEYQSKTQLFESLKKAYNEQLLKCEETEQKIEKQTQELNVKSEEIAEARQYSGKLESCLHEKELFLRNLSSVNENLKADFGQKLQNMEGKNRELVHALDEVTTRNKELEQNVCASNQEIVGIRKLLSVTEKKLFEAEQRNQESKELRQRDDVILKLEDENEKVQDQLKWKKEQFQHLEEAHKGLQDQFQMNKEEWEKEKSALIKEISSLQTNLDSQTRILEGLQTRLEACDQALVHEESRRKLLEIQVSEFESRFGNFFAHCEEEKSEIETLSTQRNVEMAKLRNTLGIKETLAKEMAFKISHLEKENQELMESLKELQESQIRNAGVTSLNKLRNKLRGLEQVHSRCSRNLKDKESGWLSQIEKMKGDISSYKSELKHKEEQMKKLHIDLESCYTIIEVLNQQIPILLTIFKSELSGAYSITFGANAEMQVSNKEKQDKFSLLTEQLKMKSSNLDNLQLELSQEHEKVEALMKRVESLELMEQQRVFLEEELQQHKRMLQESSVCQSNLKEQLLRIESRANDDKRDVSEALERANLELAEKIHETSQLKHQLQHWESNAKRLKACVEEKQETCRQMEKSLLSLSDTVQTLEHEKESLICTSKEQERKIEDQQQHIILMESRLAAKTEEMEITLQRKNNLYQIAKVMDYWIENQQKEISEVKQESTRRESEAATLARLDAEKAFGLERETLLKYMDEKECRIKALQLLTLSLEQELTSAVTSSFAHVVENQVKIDVLTEALKKSMCLTEVETEEKNKIICDLEKEVCSSHHRLKQQEESLLYMKHEAEQLQLLVETDRLETKKLVDEQERMEGIVKQLEFENGVLLQDIMKLSTEREETLNIFEDICNRIGDFSSEDVEMMDTLRKMFQKSEEETGPAKDLMVHNKLHSSTRENSNTLSTTAKKLQASSDERSPLQEVNL
ncbi:uncharacterized protein At4g38062 [Ziziphus jujuba]|uniref:Uncharacterized protein At4g38062 n=1 Tax=Ziziphus jujuba TaxID=326968 RepID=A0A6P4AWZ6_ZIZJJ|nr:uncharacterized protein At4g38062 [Ziziphus jujuba]